MDSVRISYLIEYPESKIPAAKYFTVMVLMYGYTVCWAAADKHASCYFGAIDMNPHGK
jgi:hypothetical protein